jgi:uncharacterized repeat protein (TIGR03803 family)
MRVSRTVLGGALGETPEVYSLYGGNWGTQAIRATGLHLDYIQLLYGTTYAGGTNQDGTVFKLTPAGAETVLYSLGATSADGSLPVAGLLQGAHGNFYGTTSTGGANGGGASNSGTVFEVTPAGVETGLHSFGTSSSDGAEPEGALIQDADGNLYGTTFLGGANNDGTVFKITL